MKFRIKSDGDDYIVQRKVAFMWETFYERPLVHSFSLLSVFDNPYTFPEKQQAIDWIYFHYGKESKIVKKYKQVNP